jgi:transposase
VVGVGRGELTDAAWARVEPLLPASGGRGGQWRDHRQVINAILWKLRTGAPWRDLPERYGPWKTAHERLRKWTADGTWQKILDDVVVKDDSVGQLEWVLSIDSTVVRAHQHAAGARKKGAAHPRSRPSQSPVRRSGGPAAD